MSTPTEPVAVERALMETGSGWILEMGRRDEILEQVAKEIDEFINDYKARFNVSPNPFALLSGNPDKAAAFFKGSTPILRSRWI